MAWSDVHWVIRIAAAASGRCRAFWWWGCSWGRCCSRPTGRDPRGVLWRACCEQHAAGGGDRVCLACALAGAVDVDGQLTSRWRRGTVAVWAAGRAAASVCGCAVGSAAHGGRDGACFGAGDVAQSLVCAGSTRCRCLSSVPSVGSWCGSAERCVLSERARTGDLWWTIALSFLGRRVGRAGLGALAAGGTFGAFARCAMIRSAKSWSMLGAC